MPSLRRRSVVKAQRADLANKGGAAPGVPVANLSDKARQLSGDLGMQAQRFGTGTGPLPDEVEQALAAQGMTLGGTMSPGQPVKPFWPIGTPPRAWDYPVGYNVTIKPRSADGRMSFATMRKLIDSYDVARMCIEHKQDDIRGLGYQIVPADGVVDDITTQLDVARKAMAKPDGTTFFDSWQSSFLEDVLRYDAGCLNRGRLLNGKVGALEVVDGTTIAPLLDYNGRRPSAPAPSFVQIIAGFPAEWLTDEDLFYVPYRLQSNSPYGLAPIEWLLLNANTDLRFQMHFLNYFTDGNVPDGFMEAPEGMSEATQLQQFQEVWDSLMEGDQTTLRKIKWVPHGSNYKPTRESKFDPTFPLYLMRKTCAAFKVTPNDLGFTEDVNRATGETQVDVQFRIGTKPLASYLKAIYDSYLQDDLGLPVQFQFDLGEEKEDRYQEAQAWKLYVDMGAASPDEPRSSVLGLPTDPSNPTPRFINNARAGAIPLKSLFEIAGEIDPETYGPKDFEQVELNAGEFAAPNGVIRQPDDLATAQAKKNAAAAAPSATESGQEPSGGTTETGVGEEAATGAGSTVEKELRTFARFARARAKDGAWRDFVFKTLAPASAEALNRIGADDPSRAVIVASLVAKGADAGPKVRATTTTCRGTSSTFDWEPSTPMP